MTSDNKDNILKGFLHQWHKYFNADCEMVICGFTRPSFSFVQEFYSIGKFEDYPPHKWSDALKKVLDNVADDVFMLLLDDYFLIRQTDTRGVKIIYDYMHQFENVIKFDLTSDRLNADPGRYAYNYNGYNVAGHLDLIKSDHGSQYHMSLWGGMWRKDLLMQILVPDETAQQIELNGTHRLAQYGDELLVLGTRQSPLKHANVIQNGVINMSNEVGFPALCEGDRREIEELGFI